MPRGIANNNPTNIRRSEVRWAGQSSFQPDPDFVTFVGAEWGIRAAVKILSTYATKRKAADGSPIDTIAEVIRRWAPPSENDTAAYTRFISSYSGIAADKPINLLDPQILRTLVEGIIRYENGSQPYGVDEIDLGVHLAGIAVFPPGDGTVIT